MNLLNACRYEKQVLFLSIFVAAIVAVTVSVVSCQKERIPQEPENDKYERIGQLHNEGLDYILQAIKKQPVTKSGGKPIDRHFIKNEVRSFLISKGYSDTIEPAFPIFDSMDFTMRTKGADAVMEGYSFSEVEMSYFDRMVEIGVKTNIPEFVEGELALLEQQIRHDEHVVHKDPLLYGIAVCKASVEYWSEYLEVWMVEVQGIEQAQMHWMLTKGGDDDDDPEKGFWGDLWEATWKTAVTDGASALVGVIQGGQTGTAIAPGPGTVVGAGSGALSYGLSGSALYVIGKIVD